MRERVKLRLSHGVIKTLYKCNSKQSYKHIYDATCIFQTMIADNDGLIDGPGSKTAEALIVASCYQLLLQAILAIFSW